MNRIVSVCDRTFLRRAAAGALFIVFFFTPALLCAQVTLPESGRLVGPLDVGSSELGDEFFDLGPAFGERPPAGQSRLSGTIEIVFGEPASGLVPFTIDVRARGTLEIIEFGSGFQYAQENPDLFTRPGSAGGVLDLASGEIVEFGLATIWRFGTIADSARINRIPYGFNVIFPAPLLSSPPPPGFLYDNASFEIGADGRIQGFRFFGATLAPVGFLPFSGLFPPFSFGPFGEFYFPNPDSCADGGGALGCPDDLDQPDGFPVPPSAFFHPHVFLVSHALRDAAEPTAPCLKSARGNGAAATVDGRVYRVGGVRTGRATARLDIYDPAIGTWRVGSRLPIESMGTHAVEVGGLLYVVGGRVGRNFSAGRSLQIYDPETDVWSFGPSLGTAATDAAAARLGSGLLYVAGGRTNSDDGGLELIDALQIFDPSGGVWFPGPSMPEAVERAAVAAVGSKLWVIGGAGREGVSDRVWIYDENLLAWSAGPTLPAPLVDASAAYADGELIVLGGRNSRGGPSLRTRLTIDPDEGDVWRELPDLPFPVADAGVAELRGEVLVLGGFAKASTDRGTGPAVDAVQHAAPGRPARLCDDRPFFTADTVLNASGLTVGPRPLAPGARGVIAGRNLAAAPAAADPTTAAPTELGGVRLEVGGVPAPLLAVSSTRIDFQVPWEAPLGDADFDLFVDEKSASAVVPLANYAPGIFVEALGEIFEPRYLHLNSAQACNANGSYNYAADAAAHGDVVTIQASGLGATTTPLVDGERPSEPRPILESVAVEIDGIDAQVLGAAAVPGLVGVFGVRAIVPDGAQSANRVPVRIFVGGVASNAAVISIGEASAENPLPCLPPSPI